MSSFLERIDQLFDGFVLDEGVKKGVVGFCLFVVAFCLFVFCKVNEGSDDFFGGGNVKSLLFKGGTDGENVVCGEEFFWEFFEGV